VVAELDELTALVADIVELARGTKPGEMTDDVRLDRIIEEAVERAEGRAQSPVRFEVSAEPTVVRGQPERVERAVSNLVDNALKWSPPGGTIELTLRGGELSVRDHGPGFAQDDVPHVFERFYRSQDARGMPGSSLGLASCARRQRSTAAMLRRPTLRAGARSCACRLARRRFRKLRRRRLAGRSLFPNDPAGSRKG
jgi:two-component system sensor histidine kinase MprB